MYGPSSPSSSVRRLLSSAGLLALIALFLLPIFQTGNLSVAVGSPVSHPNKELFAPAIARTPPTGKGLGRALNLGSNPPAVNWDEQLGLTISQDSASLAYNVTAVEQTDSYGYGPGYLLNGLTDKGDWYQVGVSFDWPLDGGGYANGFAFLFEVFNSTGSSVFPSGGGGGLANYTGTINPGDQILLSLNFSNGLVIMSSRDWGTGARASANYTSYGSAVFIGLQTPTNQKGYFSGLMTEDYHVQPYVGTEASVEYINPYVGLDAASMWIDEYNPITNQTLFSGANPDLPYSNPNQLLYYSLNGTSEASNAYEFITGSNVLVGITISFSIVGGGSTFLAPKLTYTTNSAIQTATLTTAPKLYFMDQGTTWAVTDPLNGSTSSERWISSVSGGNVSTSQTFVLTFTHQFLVSFGTTPSNSGTVTPITTAWYQAGTNVPLNATAKSPFLFSNWFSNDTNIQFASFTSATTTAAIEGSGGITAKFSTVALSLSSYSEELTQGTSVSNIATIIGQNQSVSLTISGLPNGASVNWASSHVLDKPAGVPDNFTILTAYATPSGSYNVTVIASTANGTNSVVFLLTIGKADALTVSYNVNDGSGSSSPMIKYVYNGTITQATLSSAPSVIYVDNGSAWQISSALNGTTTQRWVTKSPTQGMAAGPATINVVYYHQYLVGFIMSSSNASGVAPSVSFTAVGATSSVLANGSMVWADSGSLYNYSRSIQVSSVERWEISPGNQSGLVTGTTSMFSASYLEQFLVNASYRIVGSSVPPRTFAPMLTVTGSNSSVAVFALNGNISRYWLDVGSEWLSVGNFSVSSSERLIGSGTSGTVDSASPISPSYALQYLVSVRSNIANAGSIQGKQGWYPANSSVSISANANQGWRFEMWSGLGGTSNQSSTNIQVTGPVNETAIFYAELQISPSSNGHVSYSFGSNSGTASAGSTTTLYVQPGTNVSLSAASDSFLYSTGSWSGQNSSSSSADQLDLSVTGPTSIEVSFALNTVVIALIAAIAVGAGGSVVFLLVRRGGGRDFGDGASHSWKW